MSDDLSSNQPNNNGNDAISASDIFAEIMREAATKRTESESVTDNTQPDIDVVHDDFTPPPENTQPSTAHTPDDPIAQNSTNDAPLTAESLQSDTLNDEQKLAQAMAYQRVQRVKRRRERRRKKTVGTIGGFVRTMFVVLLSAGLVATILTWFIDPQFLNPTVVKNIQDDEPVIIAEFTAAPTVVPTLAVTPNWLQRIGIVAGHRGPINDPGAVCDDGWTEAEINFNVAQRIVRNLRDRNYTVDLLDEFDPRLDNYQAAALVSIHANTCQDFGEVVSGYLVAKAASRPDGGIDAILAECVAQEYAKLVPLERRYTLTLDMTDYHTFREIHPLTPAAIIELGFMLADRTILEEHPDLLAEAITNGVVCFLEPSTDYPVLTPVDNPDSNLPDNFVPIEALTPSAEPQE